VDVPLRAPPPSKGWLDSLDQFPRAFGAYRLTRWIAGGGFGVVYEADNAAWPGRRLALKTLRPEVGHTPQAQKRLLHEATVARAIDHPNVVRVIDAGLEGETPFVVMALVEGWSLAEILRRLTARAHVLDWRAAINLLSGALSGLDAIHRAADPQTGEPLGIVHRDLAPKNLMLDLEGELVVIDLGLGKSTVQDWATATGALMGTPGYMSPEQIRGGRVDLRSDVYSMGVICFELLTMRRFIPPGDPMVVMAQTLSGPGHRPTQLRPELPAPLDSILARATAVEVERRFTSMAELRGQLLEVLAGSTLKIHTLPIWQELLVNPPPAAPELELPTAPNFGAPEAVTAVEPGTPSGAAEPPTAKVEPPPRPPRASLQPTTVLIAGLLMAALLLVIALGNRPAEEVAVSVPVIVPPRPVVRPNDPTVTVSERQPGPEPVVPAAAPNPPGPPPTALSVPAGPKPGNIRAAAKTEPTPPNLRVRIDLLVTRASRLKNARPELAPTLNRIIGEASLWRGAKEEPETQAQVKALEDQLLELEGPSVTGR
jgi:serine/threonine protein kinase